jgi:hypothetical protein
VADEIIWKTRQGMIDVLAGYTPQKLLPLYVRNTLMEKNGTQGAHELLIIIFNLFVSLFPHSFEIYISSW